MHGVCANPDLRGPGKFQFARAAVVFVGRVPLRVMRACVRACLSVWVRAWVGGWVGGWVGRWVGG